MKKILNYFVVILVLFLCACFAISIKNRSYCSIDEYFNDELYYNPTQKCVSILLDKSENGDSYAIKRILYYFSEKLNGCMIDDFSNLSKREIEFITKSFPNLPKCKDIYLNHNSKCFPQKYKFKWYENLNCNALQNTYNYNDKEE